MGFRF